MRISLYLACLAALTPSARAQCRAWSHGFASPTPPGLMSYVGDIEGFDAGNGARLFVAGGKSAQQDPRILEWDGASWTTSLSLPLVPSSPNRFVSLTPATDAGGACLVAVGLSVSTTSSFIWRLQGGIWTQLGPVQSGQATSVVSFDDGSGPALYVAFSTYSGISGSSLVRRWNGTIWVAALAPPPFATQALRIFDDGTGATFYAACDNPLPDYSVVVRWNGSGWTPLGSLPGNVRHLEVYDDGAGPRLHSDLVTPTAPYTSSLIAWDGTAWQTLASNIGNGRMGVHDLGAGPRLLLNPGWQVWDGTTLSSYGPGLNIGQSGLAQIGTRIYDFGRTFDPEGGGYDQLVPELSVRDGGTWSAIGEGFDRGLRALATFDDGSGEQLYAAGLFNVAGSAGFSRRVARWNGTRWSPLASGLREQVLALHAMDAGGGARLFAAGNFDAATSGIPGGIQQWNGTSWTGLAGGLQGEGFALTGFDEGSGPRLFAGGNFVQAGGAPGNHVARWNGTSWSALGTGTDGIVSALCSHDDGGGPALFAGGVFANAGAVATGRIARWDGGTWSALGTGISSGGVNALCSFGAQLYAGGTFTNAGGVSVSYLASWNGSSWSDVPGGGANGAVLSLSVHDDGRGSALYVGGGFSSIGGITAYNIARFDGATWEAVDGGLDGAVYAALSFDDDGDGDAELFVGGDFENTASFGTGRIARLAGCPHHESFCFGDGSFVDHTTPCPCANDGAPGHGCANPFDATGALLTASGATDPDTLVLAGSGMPLSAFGIYLQHSAQGDFVFHDGVLCAGGQLIRLRNRNAVGGSSTYPDSTDTLTISQRGQVTPGSGALRYYSLFYRSASATFCPPATANVTNGIRVIW